jgi:hypothetical protein
LENVKGDGDIEIDIISIHVMKYRYKEICQKIFRQFSSRAILPSTLAVDMREEEIGKC